MGASVPAADLVMAANGASAVALSIVNAHDVSDTVREMQTLRAALPMRMPLIAGGAAALRLEAEVGLPGVSVCRDIAEARAVLVRVARIGASFVASGTVVKR